jgi:glyoxylase-like metal-dependent hydrolase (beta-lactamase superfamily II)
VLETVCLSAQNPGHLTGHGNNTYLLSTRHGPAAMIDAGVGEPRHLEALTAALQERRVRLDDVLVTHGHPDHAAGAPALLRAYRDARFGKFPHPVGDLGGVPWRPLKDGERIPVGDDSLLAVHTPGHAPDHVVFWHEASATAFTGDLVMPGGSVIIPWSRGGDLHQYLDSLERLRQLGPARLMPGHGPIVPDPDTAITRHVAHRRKREAQVLDALAAGHHTVEAIVECIYHGLDPALTPGARENVRAHLEKLKAEGRAGADEAGWTLR